MKTYVLFLAVALAAPAQTKPAASPAERTYRDSDFGFSFSYPRPSDNPNTLISVRPGETEEQAIARIDTPQTSPMGGVGRCADIMINGLEVSACGAVMVSCLAGGGRSATVPNLRGTFQDWAREKQHYGVVQGVDFGNNWFLARAIQQPSMIYPQAAIIVRKQFVGGCLTNYIVTRFPAEDDAERAPEAAKIIESFRPGDMETIIAPEKRQGWSLATNGATSRSK